MSTTTTATTATTTNKRKRPVVKKEEPPSTPPPATTKKIKTTTTPPVTSFVPDYSGMWQKSQMFSDPSSVPDIVNILTGAIGEFVSKRTPVDQMEFNMLFCSVLRLMNDLPPVKDAEEDLGNDNNGFPKRRNQTYRHKGERKSYSTLPFNPRDPLLENPEADADPDLCVQKSSKPDEYELPFFMYTAEDVDKIERTVVGFRNAVEADTAQPTADTLRNQYVDETDDRSVCCVCRISRKFRNFVQGFSCHSICNVCAYARIVNCYRFCPVKQCKSALNIAQLGSYYAFLKKTINQNSLPVAPKIKSEK